MVANAINGYRPPKLACAAARDEQQRELAVHGRGICQRNNSRSWPRTVMKRLLSGLSGRKSSARSHQLRGEI